MGTGRAPRVEKVLILQPELVSTAQDKNHRILVVDDEPYICAILKRWIEASGYECDSAEGPSQAKRLLSEAAYSLVLSDIRMPGETGIEFLHELTNSFPDIAVIMCTGVDDPKTAIDALKLGAFGYIVKPFKQNEVIINVTNALERRRLKLAAKDYQAQLEEKVQQRTREIRRREEEIVIRLLSAVKERDDETGAHIRRIGLYSAVLAEAADWPAARVDDIRLAATMHDIGKVGIPDRILLKKGPLSRTEFNEIKRHTEYGARILSGSSIPLLNLAEEIALSHHEWWNGQGYPSGLKGEAIPESARIVAIADVYDALVHKRVYKPAVSEEETLRQMKRERESHFDPRLFDLFYELAPEFQRIRGSHQDDGLFPPAPLS